MDRIGEGRELSQIITPSLTFYNFVSTIPLTETSYHPISGLNIIKWPSNIENPIVALEGKNILLECFCSEDGCNEVTAGSYWRHNSIPLLESRRINFGRTITESDMSIKMKISNVSKIDAGEYLCGINTSKGFAESKRHVIVLTKGMFYINVSL